MHEQRPSEGEGQYLPPAPAEPAAPQYAPYTSGQPPLGPQPQPQRQQRGGWRTAGGFVAAAVALFAKFKFLLLALLNFKWLILAPKLLLSFGSLIVSVWVYALFFGWKFGIVFVLLILVHELGHFFTFRNFGISASLPYFIPGLGAFVAARGPAPSLTVDAIASIAGPVYGVVASAGCYAYAYANHSSFWYAAAYVGFFLNAFNLLPIPPFDGGRIAGAIDPRLWIVGAVGFVVWIVAFHMWSPFTIAIAVLVAVVAIPRIRAVMAGYVDPRFTDMPASDRVSLATAYFIVAAIACAGAAVTHTYLQRTVGS